MSTKYPDLFAALGAPFAHHEVKTRTQAGRSLSYVTARTVANRLDDVAGPENWWDEYVPGENSVLCKLTIRLPDGQILTKCDAGGYAGMSDQGDDDKSGYSDAFKRAAVKHGVGRYLYRDGTPLFVQERTGGEEPAAAQRPRDPRPGDRKHPDEAPAQRREPSEDDDRHGGNGHQGRGGYQNSQPPRTGKALYARVKDLEQQYQFGLLKFLNEWGKLQGFPGRMVDWSAEEVQLAYDEATRKLEQIRAASDDAYEDALAN